MIRGKFSPYTYAEFLAWAENVGGYLRTWRDDVWPVFWYAVIVVCVVFGTEGR